MFIAMINQETGAKFQPQVINFMVIGARQFF